MLPEKQNFIRKGENMSNSPLVSYTKISPNKYSGREYDHKKWEIDTITIHCVVGQVTVEALGDLFAKKSRKASSNYGIGKDGRIALYVDEKDTSWCSSSQANDCRAITIEVASDTKHPYAITDKAYKALVDLCEDICRRNPKIPKLLWKGDKSLIGKVDKQNMTVHRWFAAKACPGDYIYNRLGTIAENVNYRLGMSKPVEEPVDAPSEHHSISTPPCPFLIKVLIPDLNYRRQPSMSGDVMGQLLQSTYTIVAVDNGWGKLKSGAGWVYLANPEYCEIQNGVKTDEKLNDKEFLVGVQRTDLHVRMGPGTKYQIARQYLPPGVYTIISVSNGEGSNSGWGRLKSGAGWISLDYAKRM